MSETLIVEIIKTIVAIIIALIGAYATIKASQIKNYKGKPNTKGRFLKLNRSMIFATIAVLIVSLGLVALQIRKIEGSWNTVDLGSQLTVLSPIKKVEKGSVVTFSHYPVGNVRYYLVDPTDLLVRVRWVCFLANQNITHLFYPKADNMVDSLQPNYESDPINVPETCRIDFEVKSDYSDSVNILIIAEYVP